MTNLETSIEDILKYITIYAFQRGNWQKPIDPETDKNFLEAKQAINQYCKRREVEARQDQIMQDFLSISLEVTDPEEHLIKWREQQLEALKDS